MYSDKQRMSKILPHTGSCVSEMQRGWDHYWWRFIGSDFSVCTCTYTLCMCSSSDYSQRVFKWELCCGKVGNAAVWRVTWCRMAVSEARAEAGVGALISLSAAAIWCLPPLPHTFQILHQTGGILPPLWNLCSPLMPQCIVPSTEDGKDTMGVCRDQELYIFLWFVYIETGMGELRSLLTSWALQIWQMLDMQAFRQAGFTPLRILFVEFPFFLWHIPV